MNAFAIGQAYSISFTYEADGSPQFISNRQAFYVDHLKSISFTSGAYSTSYTGDFGQINKYDNLSNFDGIQFQAAANSATYQYTNPKPAPVVFSSVTSNNLLQTFGNLYINFGSNSNALWSNYALPTSYTFSDFDQTRNFGVAFSDGSFGGGFTNLLVTNGEQSPGVPEPGTAGLVLLSGVAVVAWRRLQGR
jgi:hypothetical protein